MSSIEIHCTACIWSTKLTNPYSEADLEVNKRSIVAARAIGRGRSGLATFTGLMGMLPPISYPHYMAHCQKIKMSTEEEKQSNFSAAAGHLRRDVLSDEALSVTVTCDATWQKRGHQSLYGVVVVASWESGLILDTEVLSKWCKDCHAKRNMDPTSAEFLEWWKEHQSVCTVNYSGSSGAMEVEGALRIWRRSLEKHKLRYTTMIADGDSSTYPTIAADKPYGPDHPVKKMECVGHVQKRMYAHLKVLKKKQNEGPDGKVVRMGGRGRLTEVVMKKLQRYYGKAIRSNVGDAKHMQEAFLPLVLH